MSDCPVYFINETDLLQDVSEPPTEPTSCSSQCHCGYVQFESLIPYLPEIKDRMKYPTDDGVELEFRLRQEIVEISRIFDVAAGVKPGYFSPAHYQTTQIYSSDGTKFIKIGDFVPDTLEVRTLANQVLNPATYAVKDGYLIYMPCSSHSNTSECTSGCSEHKAYRPVPWPSACYKVTARWGKSCADTAVQRAVREYLIESYRVQDPAVNAATGLPVTRSFQAPFSWTTYIDNFKARRALYGQFAIA